MASILVPLCHGRTPSPNNGRGGRGLRASRSLDRDRAAHALEDVLAADVLVDARLAEGEAELVAALQQAGIERPVERRDGVPIVALVRPGDCRARRHGLAR